MKKVAKHLPEQQVSEFRDHKLYVPGKPLLWLMDFGWSIVGYYICHADPLRIKVAHANFFRNAKADYGMVAQEGPGPECEWRYIGNSEIERPHVLRTDEYFGEVPHGRIRS